MTIETSVVSDEEFGMLALLPDYECKGPGCLSRSANGVVYVVLSQSAADEDALVKGEVAGEWLRQQGLVRVAEGAPFEEEPSGEITSASSKGSSAPRTSTVSSVEALDPNELVEYKGKLIPRCDRDTAIRMEGAPPIRL